MLVTAQNKSKGLSHSHIHALTPSFATPLGQTGISETVKDSLIKAVHGALWVRHWGLDNSTGKWYLYTKAFSKQNRNSNNRQTKSIKTLQMLWKQIITWLIKSLHSNCCLWFYVVTSLLTKHKNVYKPKMIDFMEFFFM